MKLRTVCSFIIHSFIIILENHFIGHFTGNPAQLTLKKENITQKSKLLNQEKETNLSSFIWFSPKVQWPQCSVRPSCQPLQAIRYFLASTAPISFSLSSRFGILMGSILPHHLYQQTSTLVQHLPPTQILPYREYLGHIAWF